MRNDAAWSCPGWFFGCEAAAEDTETQEIITKELLGEWSLAAVAFRGFVVGIHVRMIL